MNVMLDQNESQIVTLRELLGAVGFVSHNIQIERGRSALFIDSQGASFTAEMAQQRLETDKAIAQLKSLRILPGSTPILSHLYQGLDRQKALREDIDALRISFSQAVNDYTYKLSMPCIDAVLELARLSSDTIPSGVSALNKFLQWKERTGRQRALGVLGFSTSGTEKRVFLDRIGDLLAEQDSYYHAFMNFADETQKKLVDVFFEKIKQEDLMHLSNLGDQEESVDSWFLSMTRKINLMRETELELLDTLFETRQISGAGTAEGSSVTAQPNKEILRSVPMFKGLTDDDLDKLLRQSSVRLYPRGKLLVQQGEPTTRIYVILHGWVKLYNSTTSGEETVLQMLSSGDTVLETSSILDSPSPYNAQVAEEATLISMPAPLIRQSVRDNPEMSFGIINNISLRSQQLIHQIEQSRLASAEERVGWFLLRLMLESGNRDGRINIPYEKALAAAFLDMRPETFSRILKKFRQQGFDIHNDKVILPHSHALCAYCQQSTAMLCELQHSKECPLHVAD